MKDAAGTIATTKESLNEPADQELLGLLGNHSLNLQTKTFGTTRESLTESTNHHGTATQLRNVPWEPRTL